MSSLRKVCWCLGLIAAAGLPQLVWAGQLQIIQESSGYVGPALSTPNNDVVIPVGKWPSNGSSPVKQLAALVQSANLSDPEILLQLTAAADINGLSDFGDVLADLHQAVSASDSKSVVALNSKLSSMVSLYLSNLSEEGGEQGGVAAPPANDACGSAVTVAIPSSTAGTLVESTIDGAPSCSVCQTTGGVWYKVVGTGSRITASLCNAATGFDSKLSVYTGTCAGLVCLDGNDDLGTTGAAPFSCVSPGGSRSGVTWCSTLGTDYYILVHSFSTLGAFQLDLSQDATACTIPANDNCAAATTVTQASLPVTDTGVVYRQAHDDIDVTCNSGTCPVARRGVWYSYTPTSATSLVISTSTTGTYKAIFVGGCGSLVQALCSTSQTLGVSGLSPGTTYRILIGHASDFSEPSAAMNVTFSLPPANDLCADAVTVAVPSSTAGTTVNSFSDAAGTCNAIANANAGVWYRVIGTGNTITADTCAAGAAGTLADTRISVYTCGCSVKQCVTANDTASPSCAGFTSRARASWCSELGKEYLILVHQGTAATSGTFRLDMSDNGTVCSGAITCPVCGNNIIETGETCDGSAVGTCTNGCTGTCTCAAPANDNCAAATTVTNGTPAATGNNCGGSATDSAEASCQSSSNLDVWFSYVATCNGAVNVTTEGSAQSDTVLSAYSSCGGTELACDDDNGTGNLSTMTFSVNLGTTYKIRIASFSTGCGGYNLNITCLPAVCGNNTIEPGEVCDGTSVPAVCVNGCTASCQCAAPANDDCGNASAASDGINLVNRAFATTDGNPQPNPPCDFPFGDDQLYHDVWLNYTASCTGRLLVDTCNGVGLDTRLAVYAGCSCPVGADPISCNDDSGSADEMTDADQDPDLCNQLGDSPFESATRNQVVQGQCYKIRLGSFGSSSTHDGVDELFIQCITKGSCCDAVGACTPGVIPSQCSTGFHSGADCVVESCCLNGNCGLLAPECCTDLGGTPGGPGSTCNNCGNGIIDCGEQCDGGACCTAQCTFAASGTTCRGSAGVCDVAEVCDGASSGCPADGFSSGNLCRGAADVCDAPESCDGSGPNCPADLYLTGNLCRGVAGVCDAPESCNGSGPACPPDLFLSGNSCRNSTGPCDPAESCNGSGPNCPPDQTITSCTNNDGCCPSGCNGNNDNDCPPVAIPTVSEWGLLFLTLIGVAVGSVVFRRRAIRA